MVKLRAYLDTPSAYIPPNVKRWTNNTHRRHTAGFYYGVPWRAATTAMLSENTQRAFYGRGVPRPNNDMDTMRTALAGEACLAPTKPCGGKAIEVILLPLQGAHELRLFIPKHHCRLLRARRAAPLRG